MAAKKHRKHRSPINAHAKLGPYCKKCKSYHSAGSHRSHGNITKALYKAEKKERKGIKVKSKTVSAKILKALEKGRAKQKANLAIQDHAAEVAVSVPSQVKEVVKAVMEIAAPKEEKMDGQQQLHKHKPGLTYCTDCGLTLND